MVIVFDVNGTLLDTGALVPRFERLFGAKYSMAEWFAELIQYSMALTLAGRFRDFGEIGGAVLQMAAAARGIRVSASDVQDLRKAMQALPPFADVPPALQRLRAANYRLAALSNSGKSALDKQLRHAGIEALFDRVMSTSAVKKFKPAPEIYRFAARTLGVGSHEILMVAAHPWDLLGAASVGFRTALITRPGAAAVSALLTPDLIASDLEDLVGQLQGPAGRDLQKARKDSDPLLLAAGLAALGIAGSFLFGNGQRRRTPSRAAERPTSVTF